MRKILALVWFLVGIDVPLVLPLAWLIAAILFFGDDDCDTHEAG